jgi:hypothetical protein
MEPPAPQKQRQEHGRRDQEQQAAQAHLHGAVAEVQRVAHAEAVLDEHGGVLRIDVEQPELPARVVGEPVGQREVGGGPLEPGTALAHEQEDEDQPAESPGEHRADQERAAERQARRTPEADLDRIVGQPRHERRHQDGDPAEVQRHHPVEPLLRAQGRSGVLQAQRALGPRHEEHDARDAGPQDERKERQHQHHAPRLRAPRVGRAVEAEVRGDAVGQSVVARDGVGQREPAEHDARPEHEPGQPARPRAGVERGHARRGRLRRGELACGEVRAHVGRGDAAEQRDLCRRNGPDRAAAEREAEAGGRAHGERQRHVAVPGPRDRGGLGACRRRTADPRAEQEAAARDARQEQHEHADRQDLGHAEREHQLDVHRFASS